MQLQRSTYDRTKLKAGVLHIGVGNFYRAHQAYYLDQLLDHNQDDVRWGIIGMNLRSDCSPLIEAMRKRDCCYVLKTTEPNGSIAFREIRSIIGLIDWPSQPAAGLAAFANPDLHLITITVTESGYYMSEEGQLDATAADVVADAGGEGEPRTVYGCLFRGLLHRLQTSAQPITVQCCDNLRHNGEVLSRCFVQFVAAAANKAAGDASSSAQQLLQGIQKGAVTFPSSMVDRITPRPPATLSVEVKDHFGISDDCSIVSESFIQWVVQQHFAAPYPPVAAVGVQLVADVTPFEEAKIRILNAGHTCIAYLGVLRGHCTYDQAIADPVLAEHFLCYQQQEAIPGLPQPSPVDHAQYLRTTKERFENRNISDALARICMDGATKMSVFVLPTIRAAFERGCPAVRHPHGGVVVRVYAARAGAAGEF